MPHPDGRPNPLTDDLTEEAKAVLAAQFVRLRCMFPDSDRHQRPQVYRWWDQADWGYV